MAKIVIKKRVGLDFLGEEYKDSYLEFKSLSLAEYQKLLDELKDIEEGSQSLSKILSILEDQFIVGKFQGEDVSKEDLKQFDIETMTKCFELFTGQQTDPKV